MAFLAELKRRKVFRVAVVYAATAFVVLQAADIMLPRMGIPEWGVGLVVALAVLGFPIALVLAWALELTPDGVKVTRSRAAPATDEPPPSLLGKRTVFTAALLVVLGIGIGAGWFLRPVSGPEAYPAGERAADLAADDPVVVDKSIAVLAFADLSPYRDQEYFADGIAEEILNALVRVPGLRVAGRTSAFHFKGRDEDLRSIGATLGVAHILEGSVRKQDDRLRITAQLIRSEDGFHLWSESFDGTDADIFALQEHIAREVTRKLRVALNGGQEEQLVNAGTRNPEAYAHYLRATEVFNRRETDRYEQGIAAARQAISLDPGYARAHSRLATLYYLWANVSAPDHYDGLMAEARRQVRSALDLDQGLAEPHAVLAAIQGADRRYGDSADALQRALAVDPHDSTTMLWSALHHCQLGAIGPCERELDHILTLDPLLPNGLGWRARLFASAGDWATAERMIDRAREAGLSWSLITLFRLALEQGDHEAAQAHMEAVNRIFGAGLAPEAATVFAAARTGDVQARERSLEIIEDYLSESPMRTNSLVPLTLLAIGEVERGLEVFANHPTNNDSLFLGEVMGTRFYRDAWNSPAFPAFLRRTGIADYWDRFGAPAHCRKDNDGEFRCE